MGNFIYKLKENADKNILGELGWDVIPGANISSLIFLKIVPQELGTELPNELLKSYYTNPVWRKQFYEKNKKEIRKKIGLRYNNKGEITYNEKFCNSLKNWILEIDEYDGGWIGFTPFDPFCKKTFYMKSYLDKFFGEEIRKLKEKDLIEEYEVNE